jgi:hypothetical protein
MPRQLCRRRPPLSGSPRIFDRRRTWCHSLISMTGPILAYAVVHWDTPDVYVAEDIETVNRVLAL